MARRGEGCERLRDRKDNKLAELRVRLARHSMTQQ